MVDDFIPLEDCTVSPYLPVHQQHALHDILDRLLQATMSMNVQLVWKGIMTCRIPIGASKGQSR